MALTTNLVAYYKLDETSGNAADSSGNSYTLTNTGTATYAAAKINNGVDLNGSSQYLTSTNAAFNVTADFTVNAWFKLDTAANATIVTNVVTDSNTYGGLYKIYTDGSGVIKAQTWASTGSFLEVSSGVTASTGTWYMATFVKDADNDWKVYINAGTPSTSTATRALSATGKNGFRIGANEGSAGSSDPSGYFCDGIVDEVGFWSRALTADEITKLYNGGSGLAHPFTIAYTLDAETGAFTLTGNAATFTTAYNFACAAGSFIVTGYNATMGRALTLLAEAGSFVLTGYDALFVSGRVPYINDTKPSSLSYSNDTKPTTTYVNDSK